MVAQSLGLWRNCPLTLPAARANSGNQGTPAIWFMLARSAGMFTFHLVVRRFNNE